MEILILEKKISWTALIAINTRDVLVVYSMRPRFLQKITFFFVLCVCVTLAKSPPLQFHSHFVILCKREKVNRSATISIFGNRRKLRSSEGTKKVSVLSKRRRFNKKYLCVPDFVG